MQNKSLDRNTSPWHEGERRVQASVGVVEHMAELGKKVIRSFLPEEHRKFYAQIPFILAGVVDNQGRPWATLLTRRAGFVQSPDESSLSVNALPDSSDPAASGFREGAGVGFLGIELHTRRRNRANGKISNIGEDGFSVSVDQTMGNCPQYIQHRDLRFVRDPQAPVSIEAVEKSELDSRDIEQIRKADTFFVATYAQVNGDQQVDVSHRGGNAGFVRVNDNGDLVIPDFSGNKFFNTLGNISLNGKAGLIFLDDKTGDVLQMTGEATVVFDSPEIDAFDGAERFWVFKPGRVVRRDCALPLRWDLKEVSPFLIDKGSWESVDRQLSHSRFREEWRPLRVTKIDDESSVIRSFYLQPVDGAARNDWQAGQHLPIRVVVEPGADAIIRTYTLSSAPSDSGYRISVKREGRVSSWLHDRIKPGDLIDARAPQGAFIMNPDETRSVVMLAGGVGITPMISMTREIVARGLKSESMRPVWLFQASRAPQQRAFDHEFGELIEAAAGAVRRVRAQTSESGGSAGDSFHPGRIDIGLLKSTLPFDDYEFYLCGPPAFMQSLYDALRSTGVRDERIHAESFGPASLKRDRDVGVTAVRKRPIATHSVAVTFSKTGKKAEWTPEKGTLLDLAEAAGLKPAFSCRGGNCGTCRTQIVQGAVTYLQPPALAVDDNEALICCAVPAGSDSGEAAAASEELVLAL